MAGTINAVGTEQLTISTTAVSLTGLPVQAKNALMQVNGADIRWLIGAVPTSTVGFILKDGDYLDFLADGSNYESVITALQFIRDGGVDGILEVIYFG